MDPAGRAYSVSQTPSLVGGGSRRGLAPPPQEPHLASAVLALVALASSFGSSGFIYIFIHQRGSTK